MSPPPTVISYSAPGKVVVWGEYAVLAGATAGVMAVNRRAQVSLRPNTSFWSVSSAGLLSPGHIAHDANFSPIAGAAIANEVFVHLGMQTYPKPFHLHTDSSAFYHQGRKLGLGSSAAVCNATFAAINNWLAGDHPMDWQQANAIHQTWQGGRGSGLDIATSWHGGFIHYTRSTGPQPNRWPPEIYWGLVWTGASTSTERALHSFSQWQAQGDTATLDALVAASDGLSAHCSLDNLHHYTSALREFDQAARQNIFTDAHLTLANLAARHQMVYKPCGAGGGDIGMVFTDSPDLGSFKDAAENLGFVWLDTDMTQLGIESNGIERPA